MSLIYIEFNARVYLTILIKISIYIYIQPVLSLIYGAGSLYLHISKNIIIIPVFI